jgi:hypothetical protein
MDTIRMDVPTFLRLMELARDTVKTDDNLQEMATICSRISKDRTIVLEDYNTIASFVKNNGKEFDELEAIRKLGGF